MTLVCATDLEQSGFLEVPGSHHADILEIFRWLWIIVSTFPHEISIVLTISSTFVLLSSIGLISFSTSAITDGLTASDGLLDQGLSSSDWCPRQNLLNHLVTVQKMVQGPRIRHTDDHVFLLLNNWFFRQELNHCSKLKFWIFHYFVTVVTFNGLWRHK